MKIREAGVLAQVPQSRPPPGQEGLAQPARQHLPGPRAHGIVLCPGPRNESGYPGTSTEML